MIPRIKSITPDSNYSFIAVFDDGKKVKYDVMDDIRTIDSYKDLVAIPGLFEQMQLDQSRTCVFWTDGIDLPSDTIYEYGAPIS